MKTLAFWALAVLLCSSALLPHATASLNASDYEEQSSLYFSRPTSVRVIESGKGLLSTEYDKFLRIKMELIEPDRVGTRASYIYFSQKHITEYVMAIEQFLSMTSTVGGSRGSQKHISTLKSFDGSRGLKNLIFHYNPPRSGVPYLSISTGYDLEHFGGTHYFTPADARELISVLIRFAHS